MLTVTHFYASLISQFQILFVIFDIDVIVCCGVGDAVDETCIKKGIELSFIYWVCNSAFLYEYQSEKGFFAANYSALMNRVCGIGTKFTSEATDICWFEGKLMRKVSLVYLLFSLEGFNPVSSKLYSHLV